MILTSNDGARFEFSPVGFEHDPATSRSVGEVWLVMEVAVRLADDRAWSTEHACLRVDELPELARWTGRVRACWLGWLVPARPLPTRRHP